MQIYYPMWSKDHSENTLLVSVSGVDLTTYLYIVNNKTTLLQWIKRWFFKTILTRICKFVFLYISSNWMLCFNPWYCGFNIFKQCHILLTVHGSLLRLASSTILLLTCLVLNLQSVVLHVWRVGCECKVDAIIIGISSLYTITNIIIEAMYITGNLFSGGGVNSTLPWPLPLSSKSYILLYTTLSFTKFISQGDTTHFCMVTRRCYNMKR